MSLSSIATHGDANVQQQQLLQHLIKFVRRSNALKIANVGLLVLIGWISFVCVAMVLDLFYDYSTSLRWMLTRASLIVAIIGMLVGSWKSIQNNTTGSLALKIDATSGTGGEITTAWDLIRSGSADGTSLTASFARVAIQRSSQLLASVEPASVLPIHAIKRPCWVMLAVIVGVALAWGIAPAMIGTQFRRFAFPSSDIPPFSGILIEMEPANLQLRYGEDAKIIAHASRKPADRMMLVTVNREGKERVLPMLPRGDLKWQALITQITEPVEYFVKSGRHRSASGKLEVQMTPEITDCIVRVTPPSYTRQAVYEGKIPEAGIAGLAGTQIEFLVTSNRPLAHGRIQCKWNDRGTEQIELMSIESDSSHSTSVQGSLVLTRDGIFEIRVTDIDALESTSSVTGKLSVLVDQKPVVRIVEPKPLSLATPDIELPVVISAEDDFGITQLRLYRSLNGSSTRFLDLPVDGSARNNGLVTLKLHRYGLSPGDEIHLFARTEDNDPQGPKEAESPRTVIRIISIAEFQERMLEQRGAEAMSAKYEAAQRHLENVATALAELKAASEKATAEPENEQRQKELQEKLQAAQKAAEQAAMEIEKLAENPMDVDIDRALVEMLQQVAKETREQANALGEMAERQSGNRPLDEEENNAIEEMGSQLQGMRDEIQEEAIAPLNELAKTLTLIQDKERFDELVERQRELAQRMQSLADSDPSDLSNERRMMEMEAAQDEIRQELNELVDRLEANADQLPPTEEFSELAEMAKGLSQKIKQSGAPELMSEAQKSLLKSKFGQAAENARAAAESLEEMTRDNQSMGDGAEENAKGAFQKPGKNGRPGRNGKPREGQSKLGRSLEQLKQRMNQKGSKGKQSGEGMEGEPGGASNGFSRRSSRPQNMGMYGSMPSPSPSSRGRSDKVSQGASTRSEISRQDSGKGGVNEMQSSDASGQSQQNIPAQYRQRVSEYYRRIQEVMKTENQK